MQVKSRNAGKLKQKLDVTKDMRMLILHALNNKNGLVKAVG